MLYTSVQLLSWKTSKSLLSKVSFLSISVVISLRSYDLSPSPFLSFWSCWSYRALELLLIIWAVLYSLSSASTMFLMYAQRCVSFYLTSPIIKLCPLESLNIKQAWPQLLWPTPCAALKSCSILSLSTPHVPTLINNLYEPWQSQRVSSPPATCLTCVKK